MCKLKALTGAAILVLMTLASIFGQVAIAQAQETSSASRQFSTQTREVVLEARNHILVVPSSARP